jgi:hypothetical protein
MNTTYYDNVSEEDTDQTDQTENIILENNNNISQLSSDSEIDDVNNTNNLNNMKKLVYQCVKYENELKKIDNIKKEIKNKIFNIKQLLIPFMENNEIDYININKNEGGGKLKYSKNKIYSSLSKKNLLITFTKYFNNEEQAQKLLNFIYENRQYKEKIKIIKSKK